MEALNSCGYNMYRFIREYSYFIYKNDKLNYRNRKKILRDIFNAWYKTPNIEGIYNEDYWKLKFGDEIIVRKFLFDNLKGLSIPQQIKFFGEIFGREKNIKKSNLDKLVYENRN
jgi:hypothetical protein